MNVKKEIKLNEKQQQIWNDIAMLNVEYFSIPNQKVATICTPIGIDPNSLYLSLKGPAALTSIEAALQQVTIKDFSGKMEPKYVIDLQEKYGVVSNNPKLKLIIK